MEPTILITNDDGVTAPGIRNLVEAARSLGRVVVVAPDSPQSGMGHAITIGHPLRLESVNIFEGVEAYQCSGTPVDCVKLARDKVLGQKPDFCFSGINHGANHSINVLYSGTMSAAMEAAIEGVPSAGFSLTDFNWDADFSVARDVAHRIMSKMIGEGMPTHTLLNVNIPAGTELQGIRLCRMAHARWCENFDQRTDPRGRDYFWMVGRFEAMGDDAGSDVEALREGYASVVPIKFDLTDQELKNSLIERWGEVF